MPRQTAVRTSSSTPFLVHDNEIDLSIGGHEFARHVRGDYIHRERPSEPAELRQRSIRVERLDDLNDLVALQLRLFPIADIVVRRIDRIPNVPNCSLVVEPDELWSISTS